MSERDDVTYHVHKVVSGHLWTISAAPGSAGFECARMAAELARLSVLRQRLTPLQREVLDRRWGLGRDEQTIDDVARTLCLTATKVTAVENEAVAALRAVFGIAPESSKDRAICVDLAVFDRDISVDASTPRGAGVSSRPGVMGRQGSGIEGC